MRPSRWGYAIQRLLGDRGWTQKQLSDAAHLRPNTLTNIIRHARHTDTETLSKIAAAFGVDIAELFLNQEQIDVLAVYRRDRVDRVAERVISELTPTVRRVVREDIERTLAEATATIPAQRRRSRRSPRSR